MAFILISTIIKKGEILHAEIINIFANQASFSHETVPIDSFDTIGKNCIDINSETQPSESAGQSIALTQIERLYQKLSQHFHDKLKVQPILTRQIVSFQANKSRPNYRWIDTKKPFQHLLLSICLINMAFPPARCSIRLPEAAQQCLPQVRLEEMQMVLSCFP